MRPTHHLAAIASLLLLSLAAGCGPIETTEELRTLAGDVPSEEAAKVSAAPAPAGPAAGDDGLDGFPPVGSIFPDLGGRLHSALCDPTADTLSRCL